MERFPPGVGFRNQDIWRQPQFAEGKRGFRASGDEGDVLEGGPDGVFAKPGEEGFPEEASADACQEDRTVIVPGEELFPKNEGFPLALQWNLPHGGGHNRISPLFADQNSNFLSPAAFESENAETVEGHAPFSPDIRRHAGLF